MLGMSRSNGADTRPGRSGFKPRHWAQAQAEHCGGRLVAVRAWRMPIPPATPASAPAVDVPHAADVEAKARKALEEILRGD